MALLIPLDQVGIGAFGVAAIALSQDHRANVRRWACICGLLAQPFWFYTTAIHGQWGIFGLSFLYTWAWAKGVRTYWMKPAAQRLCELPKACRWPRCACERSPKP